MSDPKKTNKQEGWLKKRGDKGIVKGWKNRFFVLEADPDKLYYYRSRGDPKPLGFIELSKIFSLHKTNDGAFGFAVCVPGRIYYLQAFSEGERAKWLEYFVDQTKLPVGDENTKPSTKKPKDPNAPDESSSSEESKEEEEKSKKKDKKKDKDLQQSSSNNNLANPPQSDTTVASPQDNTSKPDSAVHKTNSGSINNTNGASPEGSKSRTDSLDDANAASAETPPADIQRGKGSAVVDSYNSATVSSPPDPLLITSVENLDLSKEDSFSSFTFRPTDKDTVPPPSDTAAQTN